jgi:peptidoglycan/xylan/chitin deacetylase (PgdA/CDA1 family)
VAARHRPARGAAPFRVALTFDAEHPDRPTNPVAEPRLLETLARLGVRASFFLQGRWVEAYPDRAREVAAAGHLIGNHGFYHVRMPLLSAQGLRTDIAESERVILGETGIDPKPWFRCAFGAGGDDARVLAAVSAAGYRHVPWDVEAEDWEPQMSGGAITSALMGRLLARREAREGDGSIVLLHTWPAGAADAIEPLVEQLRDSGALLVRLDELDRFGESPVGTSPIADSPYPG